MPAVVFWLNSPSIHQAPLVAALAASWPDEVVAVAERDISCTRASQGWTRGEFAPARLVVEPSRGQRDALARQYAVPGSVHVFSGLRAYPETHRTLQQVSRTPATLGVFAEPARHNDGLKALLRRLRYGALALRWRRRLDFLLATGELGVRWYTGQGFPPPRVYPFGYFVADDPPHREPDGAESPWANASDDTKLLFVGQLVRRKGVDLLLHALARQRSRAWRLCLVGRGAESVPMRKLAEDLGLAGNVYWLGATPNDRVRALMAEADALVLPSRYDGWGAVVNEALARGTPVVVSDACGAADLVHPPRCGWVFRAGSVESLQRTLQDAVEHRHHVAERRDALRVWARRAIGPDAAAGYLREIIAHVRGGGTRPTAPWRRSTTQADPTHEADPSVRREGRP